MMNKEQSSRIKGFYDLPLEKRRQLLLQRGFLEGDELKDLINESGFSLDIADHMIENVVGTFSLPLGIALNFQINRTPCSLRYALYL